MFCPCFVAAQNVAACDRLRHLSIHMLHGNGYSAPRTLHCMILFSRLDRRVYFYSSVCTWEYGNLLGCLARIKRPSRLGRNRRPICTGFHSAKEVASHCLSATVGIGTLGIQIEQVGSGHVCRVHVMWSYFIICFARACRGAKLRHVIGGYDNLPLICIKLGIVK
jgi:hypothetical protein